jgi:hypothetical protein
MEELGDSTQKDAMRAARKDGAGRREAWKDLENFWPIHAPLTD